jgi:hypothetical protein
MCERSLTDRSFPRYPRLPMLECRGYERPAQPPKTEESSNSPPPATGR